MSELDTTSLQGVLEHVVFSNEETGWCVVRLDVPGRADPVTAVGNMLGVRLGEQLRVTGRWVVDKKYGGQFKVESYLTVQPSTLEGMEKYLGSGLIEGIGPAMAKRLVEHFGLSTLDAIENHADRLTEVEGIGPVRADRLQEAWVEQKGIKDVMIFLQSHGVSTAYAIRIYKRYGNKAIAVVRENPYQLALDVHGIGFKSADRIAETLGIDRNSPQRAEAGVLHALGETTSDGHVFVPRKNLINRAHELLGIDAETIETAIATLALKGMVITESLGDREAVYLTALHGAERSASDRLRRLLSTPVRSIELDEQSVDTAIRVFEKEAQISLADQQRVALSRSVTSKVLVITGGPGTGKTTIVNGVIHLLEKKRRRILLAAPTGRAAKRMSEATSREAKTIHRLLEFAPKEQAFMRNEETPLEADMIIIDELSMVDLPLFDSLLRAVPDRCQLVLVGDSDQLPSVGPGSVLADIIESGRAAVVQLSQIFRQAKESLIVINAHRINRGEVPYLEASKQRLQDFYLIERSSPESVLATIKEVVKNRIPRTFGLDPVDDVQVLTPMHRGSLGAQNLNTELQALLNQRDVSIVRGPHELRVEDKVMQTRNNYDLDVFNGDLGRIEELDPEDRTVVVRFDERRVRYEASDLEELTLAYACSIHKSQGSEYPAVIVPVSTQHFVMLHRNLLYTAVTRGKQLVVLVGSTKALSMAVGSFRQERRFSHLSARLAQKSIGNTP